MNPLESRDRQIVILEAQVANLRLSVVHLVDVIRMAVGELTSKNGKEWFTRAADDAMSDLERIQQIK